VEDDWGSGLAVTELVEREGFEVTAGPTFAEAREQLLKDPPHVVISDLMLPDGSGIALLSTSRPRRAPSSS